MYSGKFTFSIIVCYSEKFKVILVTEVVIVLPGAGLEPARTQGPRDFKSLVSTKFHHPGDTALILEKGLLGAERIRTAE